MRGLLALLTALLSLLAACNLQQGTPPPLPTPDAPRVEFRAPLNGSTVVEGSELMVELLATDSSAGVARVELLVDDLPHQEGKPQVSVTVPTFTVVMNWQAQGVGLHSLTAVAYRQDGTASAPAVIVITVLPDSSA
ncbi:MAG: Ig-like domain-containing protein [Chloroflexi bacterium]|nr:Ig-like domain-containing protein [Chloroflexota bacterium]